MEAVVFMGIQATGKSSFYKERFFRSHVRISLDLVRTRNRERVLLEACLDTGQPFVIDNTNPTPEDRQRYIPRALERGFRVHGYYFSSSIADALRRNGARRELERVPERGVLACYARLERPTFAEGFDELSFVRLTANGFDVQEWNDEIR
ncbi:MAG: AAA family ATPase [Deltaproteobacteria bacterium]|nr:AAA family ATPase [Deltaproteobacteria bacterium]